MYSFQTNCTAEQPVCGFAWIRCYRKGKSRETACFKSAALVVCCLFQDCLFISSIRRRKLCMNNINNNQLFKRPVKLWTPHTFTSVVLGRWQELEILKLNAWLGIMNSTAAINLAKLMIFYLLLRLSDVMIQRWYFSCCSTLCCWTVIGLHYIILSIHPCANNEQHEKKEMTPRGSLSLMLD